MTSPHKHKSARRSEPGHPRPAAPLDSRHEVKIGGGRALVGPPEARPATRATWVGNNVSKLTKERNNNVLDQNERILAYQLNCHHSMAPVINLNSLLVKQNRTSQIVAFIHEPYLSGGKKVYGFSKSFNLFQGKENCKVRSCIIISKNINAWLLSQYSDEDITSIAIRSNNKTFVLCSAYMPYTSPTPPPQKKIKELTAYCFERGWGLTIAADANSHHTAWGSSDDNDRGESLYDFINGYDLHVCNIGNRPTYFNVTREEVIDITLVNSTMLNCINDWQVDDAYTMSDHNRISFNICVKVIGEIQTYRNPKTTIWGGYRDTLEPKLNKVDMSSDINTHSYKLRNAIVSSFHLNCKVNRVKDKDRPAWWTGRLTEKKFWVEKLRDLKRKLRKKPLSNVEAHETADILDQEVPLLRRDYSYDLRNTKVKSWEVKVTNLKDVTAVARLNNVMNMERKRGLGTILKPDGTYTTTPEETYSFLLNFHYPTRNKNLEVPELDYGKINANTDSDDAFINDILNFQAIEAAFKSFKPYKAPGPDGIYPVLIQKAIDLLLPHLYCLYKKCLLQEKSPKKWLEALAAFIPKAGKAQNDGKSVRPLCLSSFMLKGLERLIYWYLYKTTLYRNPFDKNLFSYREGVGTDDALHAFVSTVEKARENNLITVVLFIDISSAFNNASVSGMLNNLVELGTNLRIVRWCKDMLENRSITAEYNDVKVTKDNISGTPQGGILSGGINWNSNANQLIKKFPRTHPTKLLVFADDKILVASGIDINVIMDNLRRDVQDVLEWCRENTLTLSEEKTKLMMITRKKNIPEPDFFINNKKIEWVSEFKYLGVIIDKDLNFNSHVNHVIRKSNIVLAQSRRILGKKWGPQAKIARWIYTSLIVPILTYGIVVWIKCAFKDKNVKQLERIQRRGMLAIMNTMNSTPTAGMEVLLNFRPIDILLQETALKSYHRMKRNGNWRVQIAEITDSESHAVILRRLANEIPIILEQSDVLKERKYIESKFTTTIKTRDEIPKKVKFIPRSDDGVNCFTDGSKTDQGTGCGYIFKGKQPRDIHRGSKGLNPHNSVFQAEVFAIGEAAREMNEAGYTGKSIMIHVDSQAAIKAVGNYLIKSKLIESTKISLNRLCEENRVEITWIPAHVGHLGNEFADRLAKKGTEMRGDQIVDLPYSNNVFYKAISDWGKSKHQTRWSNATDYRQTRMMCPSVRNNIWKYLKGMSRKNIMIATQILTGHTTLRYHLYKMKIEPSPTCQQCNLDSETVEHFLRECPKYRRLRYEIFREFELKKELYRYKFIDIMKFVKQSKRFIPDR